MWNEAIILLTTTILLTEQRPPFYVANESYLLEEIRPVRSAEKESLLSGKYNFEQTKYDDSAIINTSTSSSYDTIVDDDDKRNIRSVDAKKEEGVTTDSSSTEQNTQTTEIFDLTTVSEKKCSLFAVFVKLANENLQDDIVQKRSANNLAEEKKNVATDEEDAGGEVMDTAANTVFRPLFAYRQQNAQRRRLNIRNN